MGLAFIAVAILCDSLDDWAANIAVSAFSIALTIAVVERLIRHEEHERVRPRLERVYLWIGRVIGSFAFRLIHDYETTHLATWEPFPDPQFSEIAQHWLAGLKTVDAKFSLENRRKETVETPLDEAQKLSESLRRIRASDWDVLDDDLLLALDEFLSALNVVEAAREIATRKTTAEAAGRKTEEVGRELLGMGAVAFLRVFERFAPDHSSVSERDFLEQGTWRKFAVPLDDGGDKPPDKE